MPRVSGFLLSLGAIVLGALAVNACVHEDQVLRDTYDTNYRRAVQLCGKPERAYQDGYNEGYGHARMYSEWADFCAPEACAQAISAYQDGFSAGASNAPVRVEHTIRGRMDSGGRRRSNGGVRGNNEIECRFDSDCGGRGYGIG